MSQQNEIGIGEKIVMGILGTIIFIALVTVLSPISVMPEPVKVSYPYESYISCIDFSSDSKLIAVGYSESDLRLWDIENGNDDIYDPEGTLDHERLMRDIGDHITSPVISIDFSPNDEYIISGGKQDVKLWGTQNGTSLRRFITLTPASTITFSPDGKTYAFPSENHGIEDMIFIDIIDTNSSKVLSTLESSNDAVESMVFTPDGKYLLARYDNGNIVHWDWKNSTVSNTIYTSDDLKNFDFSDDASTCAGLSWSGTITVWNTTNGDVVDRFYSYLKITSRSSSMSSRSTDLDLSSDGKYLATSMVDRLSIWDISSGDKILDINLRDKDLWYEGVSSIKDIEFSPDTEYLAASARIFVLSSYYFGSDDVHRALNGSVDRDLLFYSLGGEEVVFLWNFQELKEGKYV